MAQWAAFASPGFDPQHKTGRMLQGCNCRTLDGGSGVRNSKLSSASKRIQGEPGLGETMLKIKLNRASKNSCL